MADLPFDGGNSNNSSLQLFDFENYYKGYHAEPASTPDAGTQGLNSPRALSQKSRFEPYQKQVGSSEITTLSQTYEDNFPDNQFESLGGPSRPPTTTGNEPLHQYGQPSRTDIPNAELHGIEDELEEVELRLKRRELLRRRQELLQNMSRGQQAVSSDCPESQSLNMASDSSAQTNSQHMTSRDPSQRSDLLVSIIFGRISHVRYANGIILQPTAIEPINYHSVELSNVGKLSTSSTYPIQMLSARVDSRYTTDSTNPSSFGFANLSSNAYGRSSHFEGLGQSGKDCAELMPAGLLTSESNHQHEMQTPVPALVSDQTTMQSFSKNLQHRHGLGPVQSVSTLSSFQHDRPVQNSETNMIIRKRPRSPQPTEVQRLSAIQHQLSKRTGVPEISLGVMCFNTEPRPKRNRTSSQKQNKKDVEKIGGSCFLCLVFRKKVFL